MVVQLVGFLLAGRTPVIGLRPVVANVVHLLMEELVLDLIMRRFSSHDPIARTAGDYSVGGGASTAQLGSAPNG